MKASSKNRLVLSCFLLLSSVACQSSERARPNYRPSEPTKDEVALIDGRPLTLSGFYAVRKTLKTRSVETVFWTSAAAMAMISKQESQGRGLSTQDAIVIARYALGELSRGKAQDSLSQYFSSHLPSPTETKQELDQLLSGVVVRRNDLLWVSLNQS